MKSTKRPLEAYYDSWFKLNKVYDEWAKSMGLTVNSLFVLHTIANKRSCTQSDIVDRLMLPKQTINSILDGFMASGYIKKKESRKDKRSKVLTFTPRGRKYSKEILIEMAEHEQLALDAMGEDAKQKFVELNAVFVANVENEFTRSKGRGNK